DVARANGVRHIAACTGNASEDAMRRRYALPEIALIEMGEFAGAVLKHLRRAPVEKLSLCGGFGKISKLAGGPAGQLRQVDAGMAAVQVEVAA
ncbi:cobalt-precorrin-5B (C(1))-methyltransferase, partial [Pseudomonas aeruginosa]